MSIGTCQRCGGLFSTEPGEMYVGKPCKPCKCGILRSDPSMADNATSSTDFLTASLQLLARAEKAEAELATLRALCVRKTDALKCASFLGYLCDEGGKAIPRDSVEYKDIHDGIQKALKLTPADLHDCVTVKRNVWESTQKMTEDAQKIATALIERVGNLEAELLKEIQANASLTEDLSVARLVTGTTSSYDDLLSRFKKYSATMESERTALRQQNAELVAALAKCRGFVEECVVAEDRSNLDGDSAEVVLTCINEGAEYLLKDIKALASRGEQAKAAEGGK